MTSKYILSKKDKNYLLEIGYLEQDFGQIQAGINKGTFTHDKRIKGTRNYKERKIGVKTVIKYVGKEKFLASCGRASFHWTTSDVLKGCSESHDSYLWGFSDECISYDFSNLFK